ncbi:MFS transporter [Paraburkholderia sp. D15]|uniref:MFS transporter n=1 Tax=Paraburkholderia sp. D15 TaxID=2880218 RepID=UPI002479F118|nr:MFS transporter [Paraburkholderia sp. D15]WGS53458.1 MFS transporter [Paraburkholderia sp. D15]
MRKLSRAGCARRGRRFHALAGRDFRRYTCGNALSLTGTWLQRIGAGWLAWESSGSSLWLGIVAFADLFPTVLFAPLAGVMADRHDRRKVVLYCQVVAMAMAVLQGVLLLGESASLTSLLLVTSVTGIANALCQPARMAWISNLVPRRRLASAVAINSLCFNLARFVGPAVAGVVLVQLGVAALFWLNALSYAVFIGVLLRMPAAVRPSGMKADGRWLEQALDGFRYLASAAPLRGVFVMLSVSAVCVRGVPDLAPAISEQLLQRGPRGFATLVAAAGLGALAGGVWISGRGNACNVATLVGRHVLAAALCTLALAVTRDFHLALGLFFALGFSIVVTGIGAQTLIHLSVPEPMRGRVLGSYGVIYRGGPALSALWLGAAAPFCGLGAALALAGLSCVTVCCVAHVIDRVAARREAGRLR